MKILYFAWFREELDMEEEDLELPDHVKTVDDLIVFQRTRGPAFEKAFESKFYIRVALDQDHADFDAALDGVGEVAFFPPITGG